MIKPIMKDVLFLGQKSEPATKADLQVVIDLQDTLAAHREECVGMAANMIGIKKRVIIVNMGMIDIVMFNPVIRKKSGAYETEEGCLSLTGVRKTTRYEKIEVDGGINADTLPGVLEAGANVIVAGSAVFKGNIAENVRNLKNIMEQK